MQKAKNFNDVAIVFIKGNDYRIHLWYMSKDDVICIMNNSNLNEKREYGRSRYHMSEEKKEELKEYQ